MKKKFLVLGLSTVLGLTFLAGCGKKDKEDNVIEKEAEVLSEADMKALKQTDVNNGKVLYTAIQNAMASEECFAELTGKCANQLISYDENGMSRLSDKTRDEIVKAAGGYFELQYKDNEVDKIYFMVDMSGKVTVFAGNENFAGRYELAPDKSTMY